MKADEFSRLLSPFSVGGLALRNRIVKAPQDTHFVGPDGHVEKRVIALYEALARGGAGLIILASVPPIAMAPEAQQIALWDDEFIPGLAQVADAVHRHGSKIFVQLNHGGPAEVDHFPTGRAWSASTLEAGELPSPAPHFKPVRGLDPDEITAVEEAYIRGAERAHAAGFDGVEVHAAHTYMLACFLTRIWNRRTDDYGPETATSRTRIVANIIRGIRARVGARFPIGVRLNGREWGSPYALTVTEAVENAQAIDQLGVAYISVTGYGHGPVPFKYVPDYWRYPEPQADMEPFVGPSSREGLLLPAARTIREAVGAPVIGVGGLTPETAERALANGSVDLVALGRALWADHELPIKLMTGRSDEVRPCTRCATCEVSPRKCRVNAALGGVEEYELQPAAQPRRVIVVGGGPAGMEAARVAASRGHAVTLYERERNLGGMLPLAVMVKGTETEDILGYLDYLKHQLKILDVDVRLGIAATPDDIRKESADVVVVAVGGTYDLPPIPGMTNGSVTTTPQLASRARLPLRWVGPERLRALSKMYLPFGKHVVVIGARIEGVETAEYLIKRGREVTIIDTAGTFGDGMPQRLLMRLRAWLDEKGTPIHLGADIEEITDDGVRVRTATGDVLTIPADDVVVAAPQGPNKFAAQAFADVDAEVHIVGPQNTDHPWLIVDAVAAGFQVGSSI